jgi:hypothetical protein
MLGHTDKATINQRRPLTENMRQTLRAVILAGELQATDLDQAEKNAMRALMDRGLVDHHMTPSRYSVTDAGREAWHN